MCDYSFFFFFYLCMVLQRVFKNHTTSVFFFSLLLLKSLSVFLNSKKKLSVNLFLEWVTKTYGKLCFSLISLWQEVLNIWPLQHIVWFCARILIYIRPTYFLKINVIRPYKNFLKSHGFLHFWMPELWNLYVKCQQKWLSNLKNTFWGKLTKELKYFH